jgi:hypothetical protein
MIATAAIEVHAATLIVSATATVAVVESIFTAANVSATTASNWLSLLALALLLASTTAARSTILVVLLWVLEHAGRGLVADGIAQHLNLPLHRIDGGIIAVQAVLLGGVCCTKAGNSIGQGGC